MMQNAFLHIFFNDFVKAFRRYDQSGYSITINGIEKVIDSKSPSVVSLLEQLRAFGISVVISGGGDSVHSVEIDCVNAANDSTIHSQYYIQNIPSLIELASKTGIPFSCLLIMKVVASVISRLKVLYKAIVLDLDDTLWKGTLSEDGIDVIKENLVSKEGAPFISFMRFLKVLTEELGIFIAVCSRNDNDLVVSAIDELDESLFPIKNQIDCIVANNNNKSDNLSLIAQQLSILPGAIVFIDDNKIIRSEVKTAQPDICVPEWDNHDELVSAIICGCLFDRNELSLKSKNRRKQFRVILAERKKSTLPSFPIAAVEDYNHSNAVELYTKSNQFNFSQQNNHFDQGTRSFYFELFRDNGESLGVCSAITVITSPDTLTIVNWAMSCRFFEIGVEETVLLFISKRADFRKVRIHFNDSGLNKKAKEIIYKYPDLFVDANQPGVLELLFTPENIESVSNNTNLIIQ